MTQPATTPDAILGPLVDAVASEVERRLAARDAERSPADWVDQARSPLGRRLHCRLVREGELPGAVVHRRVLVKRADLNRYISAHRSAPAAANDSAVEASLLARVGARRVAA